MVAGACIGRATEAYGWARVRPAAWALLLLVFLDPMKPTAGIVGGAAGGAFSGALRRSWADTLRGALRGAALGLASWAVAWGYLRLLMKAAG